MVSEQRQLATLTIVEFTIEMQRPISGFTLHSSSSTA